MPGREGMVSVPDLLLERLALGDLDADRAAQVRARLAASGASARLEALEASNRTILAAHPPAVVLAEVQRRLAAPILASAPAAIPMSPPARPRARWPQVTLAVAGTAALILIAVQPELSRRAQDQRPVAVGETIGLRGLRPHLVVYRKTTAGPTRLTEEDRVRPGDVLQVAYVAAGRRYGVIASQDARGSVTLHLPSVGGQAATLADRGETATASAFELDDSAGFERFVFLTSQEPFSTTVLEQVLTSPDGLPPGLGLTEIVLQKEVP
jgi:hypothetical protein